MSYLKNITRAYGTSNLGGLLTIQVARKDDIESIPEPVNGVVYGDIVLKPARTSSVGM